MVYAVRALQGVFLTKHLHSCHTAFVDFFFYGGVFEHSFLTCWSIIISTYNSLILRSLLLLLFQAKFTITSTCNSLQARVPYIPPLPAPAIPCRSTSLIFQGRSLLLALGRHFYQPLIGLGHACWLLLAMDQVCVFVCVCMCVTICICSRVYVGLGHARWLVLIAMNQVCVFVCLYAHVFLCICAYVFVYACSY